VKVIDWAVYCRRTVAPEQAPCGTKSEYGRDAEAGGTPTVAASRPVHTSSVARGIETRRNREFIGWHLP
jgi:hypothetical protein